MILDKKIPFSVILSVCLSQAFSQAGDSLQLNIVVGTTGDEELVDLICTEDKLYAFGNTGEVGNGLSDVYVIALDTLFYPESIFTLGTGANERLKAVARMGSGIVMLSDFYSGDLSSGYDCVIHLYDSAFHQLHSYTIDKGYVDAGIALTVYGNRIGVLHQYLSDNGYKTALSLFDQTLSVTTTIELEQDSIEYVSLAFFDVNDSVCLLGTLNPDLENSDIGLNIIDLNNSVQNVLRLGSQKAEIAGKLYIHRGHVYVVGSTKGFALSVNDYNMYLARLTDSLTVDWEVALGNIFDTSGIAKDDFGIGLLFVDSTSQLIATMTTSAFGSGETDYHAYTLDSVGNFINGKSYGFPKSEVLSSSALCFGKIVLGGTTNSIGAGQRDIYLAVMSDTEPGKAVENRLVKDTVNHPTLTVGNKLPRHDDFWVMDEAGETFVCLLRGKIEDVAAWDILGRRLPVSMISAQKWGVETPSSPVVIRVVYDSGRVRTIKHVNPR
ncbi:MAG: hypothetical protein Kow0075_06870 [Salibacteraceae bacterium]